MDMVVCVKCGQGFPRFEEIGRLQQDWSIESDPMCPSCRGLEAPEMPKKNVLGGYPPGRKPRVVQPTSTVLK